MKDRKIICEGYNSNKLFRAVRDIYYKDEFGYDNQLTCTDEIASIEYKLQVKILCFWVTIKTNTSNNFDDDNYLYKVAISELNKLID